jgi:trigger factor
VAEILEREGYRVRFRVEVPPAEVDQTYRSVLQYYARRIRIPGFRPGRVPEKVLQARIGREALLQEVQERLIDRTYPQAIRELALLPVENITHLEKKSPTYLKT